MPISWVQAQFGELADVPAVLGWGDIMEAQAALAAWTAQMLWRIPAGAPQPAGYVD